jgi:hypothetical protein
MYMQDADFLPFLEEFDIKVGVSAPAEADAHLLQLSGCYTGIRARILEELRCGCTCAALRGNVVVVHGENAVGFVALVVVAGVA